jgi:hypothetical protein
VGGHLSEEVRVTSGVPQESVLGPLLFLAYVNDIWINIDSTIRLFADDRIIYKEVKNNNYMENLQTDLNRLGKWAVENAMKIKPTKSKVVCFTRARVKEPLNYTLGGAVILGIFGNNFTQRPKLVLSGKLHGEKSLEGT